MALSPTKLTSVVPPLEAVIVIIPIVSAALELETVKVSAPVVVIVCAPTSALMSPYDRVKVSLVAAPEIVSVCAPVRAAPSRTSVLEPAPNVSDELAPPRAYVTLFTVEATCDVSYVAPAPTASLIVTASTFVTIGTLSLINVVLVRASIAALVIETVSVPTPPSTTSSLVKFPANTNVSSPEPPVTVLFSAPNVSVTSPVAADASTVPDALAKSSAPTILRSEEPVIVSV